MSSSEDESVKTSKRAKTIIDDQRIKLEKLMANPDKEVYIPELKTDVSKPRAFFTHEFVRNVMGASAGAGSGEFDIYRGCRRRELIRQEFLEIEDKKKKATEEFEKRFLENKLNAEAKTSKKREKRLKAKEKLKNKKSNNETKNHEENLNKNNEKNESDEELEEIDLTVKVDEKVLARNYSTSSTTKKVENV